MDFGDNQNFSAWDTSLGFDEDTMREAALRGAQRGITMGVVSPEQAQARLKKMGLLPKSKKDLAEEAARPAPDQDATKFAQEQTPAPHDMRNLTNPKGSLAMAPTMNQPAAGAENLGLNPGFGSPVVSLSGEKSGETDSNKFQRTSQMFQLPPPELLKAKQYLAMGVTPGMQKDEQGNPRYEQATDSLGRPLYSLPDGTPTTLATDGAKPIYDKSHPMYDFASNEVDPMHPVQQQMAGLNRMQDFLKMENDVNAKQPLSANVNLAPLANLADYENAKKGIATHLASNYEAPENYAKMRDKFLAYQQQMMKDRGEIQKSIYENMKTMGGGTISDLLAMNNQQTSQNSLQDAVNKGNAMGMLMDDRDHRQTVQNLQKNPELQRTLAGLNTLRLGMNLLNSKNLNPQLYREAQVQIRMGLQMAAGSRTGVDERASTYMTDMGIDWEMVKQAINSDINKLDPHSAKVAHFRAVAADAVEKMNRLYQQQLDAASQGHASLYARRPDLAADLEKLVGAKKAVGQGVVAPTPAHWKPKVPSTNLYPPGAENTGKPLEKMTNDELKAFIKANGS